MQPNRFATAANWLGVAADDLIVASELADRLPNVACFHAQQAAEKAIKAWLVALSGDVAREHLMESLISELEGLGTLVDPKLREDALALGKFYITTRYPDALGGADPRTAFVATEARDAVARAERVFSRAKEGIERQSSSDESRSAR